MLSVPQRGDIWIANLDPIIGHEQAGTRPILIVSTNKFNQGFSRLVFAAPITKTNRNIPYHIKVNPPEGGLRYTSFILCDSTRALSTQRLIGQALGKVNQTTIEQVENVLKVILEL